MATSKVKICNLALAAIGIKQQIAAITDQNPEAEMCELHYDDALEGALTEADWAFARRRTTLIAAAGDSIDPWGYKYDYPVAGIGVLKALRIDDKRSSRPSADRIPFVVETDDSGNRFIYTNQYEAVLVFTHNSTDPTLYPTWFTTYLAMVLASKICKPLTGDEDEARKMEARAMHEMEKGVAKDFEFEQEDPEPEAGHIIARNGSVPSQTGVKSHDYWS